MIKWIAAQRGMVIVPRHLPVLYLFVSNCVRDKGVLNVNDPVNFLKGAGAGPLCSYNSGDLG